MRIVSVIYTKLFVQPYSRKEYIVGSLKLNQNNC